MTDPEPTVEVDAELVALYASAKARLSAASADCDVLRERLIKALPDGGVGAVDGVPMIRCSVFAAPRLDSKRLRMEWPDVAEQYTSTTTAHRLILIKGEP